MQSCPTRPLSTQQILYFEDMNKSPATRPGNMLLVMRLELISINGALTTPSCRPTLNWMFTGNLDKDGQVSYGKN